jgi:hypothetical protein
VNDIGVERLQQAAAPEEAGDGRSGRRRRGQRWGERRGSAERGVSCVRDEEVRDVNELCRTGQSK